MFDMDGTLWDSTKEICYIWNEVLKEYQKEFYAEGQMYFTYKRIGARKMLWNEEREIRLDEYQIPLPETEFTY